MKHKARFRVVLEGTYEFESPSPVFEDAIANEREIILSEPDILVSDADELSVEIESLEQE